MKKLIIITFVALTVLATFFSTKQQASASSTYAMIVSEDACFYSDASCRYVKFYLPYSYFVKIVSQGVDYSRVVYMDNSPSHPSSEGYVANADLDFSISPNQNPYPNVVLIASVDEVLFGDTAKTQPKAVVNTNSEAVYYGKINVAGETYLYVYSNGHVGYVRENCFSNYTIPTHPTLLLNTSSASTQTSKEIETIETTQISKPKIFESPTQIIVVAVMIIAALSLIYLILRPERKKIQKEQSFFSDTDDY